MNISDDDFAEKYRRLRSLLIVSYVVTAAVTIGMACWYLYADKRDTLIAALAQESILTRALTEHVLNIFSALDTQLISTGRKIMDSRAMAHPPDAELVRMLQREKLPSPYMRSLYTYEPSGRGHTTSLNTDITKLDARKAEHFRKILDARDDRRALGHVSLGPVSGEPIIQLARGMVDTAGHFRGIIGTALDPDYFLGFYQTLILEREASIGIMRDDGAVLVQFPPTGLVDSAAPENAIFRDHTSRLERGTVDAFSAFDGTRRIISFRHVPGWNLVVFNSLSYDALLVPWGRSVRVILSLVFSALLIGLLILRQALSEITKRHDSEQRYRELLNQAGFGIFVADDQGTVIVTNTAARRLLERTGKSLPQITLGELITPDKPPSTPSIALESLRPDSPVIKNMQYQCKDGSSVFAELSIQRCADGAFQVLALDITSRVAAQDALQESQLLLSRIIESAMDAIITVDASLRVLVFNRAAETMFQCKAVDAIGQPLARFLPQRIHEMQASIMHKVSADDVPPQGSAHPLVVVGVRSNSDEFPVETTLAVATSGGEQLFTFMLRDIEGRIAAAEVRRDALVREVHHRIKNNLQGVIGLARQHLLQHPQLADLAEGLIGKVSAISVVHGMHGERPGGEITLYELVTEISRAAMAMSGARIDTEVLTDKPNSIRVSKDEAVPLALVLNELLANAIKHGRHDAGSTIRVRISTDGEQACVDISGPGRLAPGVDFANGSGLGIGLDLVQSLLPRQGAFLDIIQNSDEVLATLTLGEPVIAYSHQPRQPC